MNSSMILALISLVLVPGFPTCAAPQKTRILTGFASQSKPIKKQTQNPPLITIWVHGTRFFPEAVLKKFFYCKDGLNHYTSLDPSYRHNKLAQILIDADPDKFDAQNFYLFGWSGALSFTEREKAAKRLYLEIKKLRADYRAKYGIEPEIRILAHSHGGNVSLLLDKVKDADDLDFCIQELIMLATPVQHETKKHVTSPLFKKVYSLYSHIDSLQVIDPQGLQTTGKGAPLFSGRRFDDHDSVCQCAIKLDGRYLMHVEFIKGTFLCKLPFVLNALDIWQKELKLKDENWHDADRCLNVCIKNGTSGKADFQAL